MKRYQLEHIIRASADIADDDEIIVVGRQSILGQFANPPVELLVSVEADVYPKNFPERWELIDGSIGELSPFHTTFGYYAQGVESGTSILPNQWQDRLQLLCNVNTRGVEGLCLEVHDLTIAKYVARRDEDRDYVRVAINAGLVEKSVLFSRLALTPVAEEHQQRIRDLIENDFRLLGR